jgi:hypothetical protein
MARARNGNARGAERRTYRPLLQQLENRLPPGDAVWGALVGWGAIAASDSPPTADSLNGLSAPARLVTALDAPEGLAALAEGRPDSQACGAGPASAYPPRAEPGLRGPDTPQAAPASRLAGAGQGIAALSDAAVVTAPPGPGNPAPALAAVAGAIARNAPSALAAPAARQTTDTPGVDRPEVMSRLSRSGLSFEPNVGQTASRVDYLARTGGGTVFLTPTAAVFSMQERSAVGGQQSAGLPSPKLATPRSNAGVALYMDIVGANPAARPVGQDPLPGKVNYFIGNDPANWHTDIPTFGRVEYPNIYPGVSLAYYGGPDGLELQDRGVLHQVAGGRVDQQIALGV